MTKELTMYIVMNMDLNMSVGKEMSQIVQLTRLIVDEIKTTTYESSFPLPSSCIDYIKWSQEGTKTIILKASEKQLREEIMNIEGARYFVDEGRTQVLPNSLTCVGFYPRSDLYDLLKNYRLR